MPAEKIEAGDIVRHKPSGQRWVVWGVDTARGWLAPMGWPNTLELLGDCELAEKGHGLRPEERRSRKDRWGRQFDDDREEDAQMDREWAL